MNSCGCPLSTSVLRHTFTFSWTLNFWCLGVPFATTLLVHLCVCHTELWIYGRVGLGWTRDFGLGQFFWIWGKWYLKMEWHPSCNAGEDRTRYSQPSHPAPCSLRTQTRFLWKGKERIMSSSSVKGSPFLHYYPRTLTHLSASASVSPL